MIEEPHFTCPRCGKQSWHPMDLKEGYRAKCHAFTGDDINKDQAAIEDYLEDGK